jgi:molybdopterin-dependent oxidoreductase alpha subunit
VQIRVGGDLALFQAIGALLLRWDAVDHDFVATHTEGFAEYRSALAALDWSDVERCTGLAVADIQRVARAFAESPATIVCWAMGLTQQRASVPTIREIVNVQLLRGMLGRPGAGLCPVRGHSNVQGDRTMGITVRPRTKFLANLREVFGFEPPGRGRDVVETIAAIQRGDTTALVCLGGNFLSANPDTDRLAAALDGLTFSCGITTKLNRSHLHPGRRALLLPCLGRTEIDVQAGGPQFVTVEDSMSIVHRSQGVLAPASPELRSEPAIVAGLGKALLGPVVDWDDLVADYDRIRDLVEKVVPGFADFNQRVRAPHGFRLPNAASERDFAAVGGKASFTVSTPPDLALPPGRLRLMTLRSHDQYNTTIYGLDDRYRGVRGERRVVFMNAADMAALGLAARQVVDLISEWDGEERRAARFIAVPFDLPRGNAASYFPEANALVPLGSVADKSNTPTSKSIVIRVEAARR